MPLSWIVLLILAVLYVPFYIWVRISPKAEKYGLRKYGPCVMIRTRLGIRLMDKLAKYTRFWRFWGVVSQIIAFFLMAVIVYIMVVGLFNLATNMKTGGLGIEYALAIPGINPLLPIGYGILGLLVAMVIHELAHGFQTRANGMRVDSTGLLHIVVPMGAFVEPNEEDVGKSSRRAKLDLYSAGIAANFIVALVSFGLFASVLMGGITSPYGDDTAAYAVSGGSPADAAGIPSGSIIEYVNGEKFKLPAPGFETVYSWNPGDTVTVSYVTQDGNRTADMRWGVYVEKVIDGTPAAGNIFPGYTMLSMTSGGSTYKLYAHSQFSEFLSKTSPGDTITISCMTKDGTVKDVSVTLASNKSKSYLGVAATSSGMSFTTPNKILEKATNPFAGAKSLSDYATSSLKYISGPFNGFNPIPDPVKWWYDVPLGGAFWVLVSAFFWIFWLNVMLGVSNAIPAVPFDGGFIFMGWLDALLQRTGVKDEAKRKAIADRATSYMSMIMITMLVVVIAATVI